MGEVTRAISQPFTAVTDALGNAVGGDIGAGIKKGGKTIFDPLNAAAGEGPQAPSAPGVDPRMESLKKEQERQAQEFREKMPQAKEQAMSDFAQQEKSQLAGDLAGVKAGAQSRGLLYSGKRQAAELGAKAKSAGRLAKAKQDINISFEDQAKQMENAAIDSGAALQRAQQGMQNEVFNQALSNMQERSANIGALGGVAGSLIGGAMGRK